MSFKKLIAIISVVIVFVFTLMLTTSYAWYSFKNASTSFKATTANNRVKIAYQKGEYIDTSIAVPIKEVDADKYADKNSFSISVTEPGIAEELVANISLVNIEIDGPLQNANFKVELYYQGNKLTTVAGNSIGTNKATTKALSTITLDNNVDNNFEVRVYILDNNADQSSMMNKTFKAKVKVDVISRKKTEFID